MDKPALSQTDYLQAMIKAYQYLAGLISDREVWLELEKLLTHYFQADLVAFLGRRPSGEIVLHHCSLAGIDAGSRLLPEISPLVAEVLESGFLVTELLGLPQPYAVAFLPVAERQQTTRVMVVGHRQVEPLDRPLLDIYLALAGLCGTTLERLSAERRVQRMTEKVPAMLFELLVHPDGDLEFTYVSRQAGAIFGPSPDTLLDNPRALFQCLHPKEQQSFLEALTGPRAEGIHLSREIRCGDSPIGEKYLLCHALSSLQEGGILVWDGAFMDISERKRAEREMDRLRRQNELLLNSAGEGIFGVDLEGRVTFANPAAGRMVGWEPQDLIGNNHHALIHYRKTDGTPYLAADCPIYAVFHHGQVQRADDEVFWRRDGTSFPVEYTSTPIRDEKGATLGAVVVFRDVTVRKQAEEEVRKLNAELEQRVRDRTAQLEEANKELEGFAYSVSHDLRAPLRAIHGYSQVVQKECAPNLDPAGQGFLKVIQDSALKMDALINDLLAFSRLGRQALKVSQVDMDALVKSVITELQAGLPGRRALKWNLQPLSVAQADKSLLRQVWINLLTNALKFTRLRDQALVEVGCRQERDEVIYYVQDNGAGFDMRYAGRLFDVFQRFHREDEFEGTGIGLAIVQRIISRHGGRVWAEGKVNAGATFYFTLPTDGKCER
jgi:PAS domain S-box-containing protein